MRYTPSLLYYLVLVGERQHRQDDQGVGPGDPAGVVLHWLQSDHDRPPGHSPLRQDEPKAGSGNQRLLRRNPQSLVSQNWDLSQHLGWAPGQGSLPALGTGRAHLRIH